ncbi:MAG: DNA replication/repair protein RecF [Gammaproteobacteria bacterium]|nr:DNA replication/repair protein RecF [Gammaproteobacteria bacterium]
MNLVHLEVQNVRILRDVSLTLAGGLNAFVGPNGAGKTSLLEAVHVLATGHSFRTRRLGELVRRDTDWLRVRGEVAWDEGSRSWIGVEKQPDGLRVRVGGEDVRSASSLARQLPAVVVSPDSQRLLTDGANLRRQLIDWALFHVEPAYFDHHRRFRRVLRQRNAALRDGVSPDRLDAWDREMAELGEQLHTLRARHMETLIPAFGETLSQLMTVVVEIAYQAGWRGGQTLAEALAAVRDTDRERGFTSVGPHRGDLQFRVAGGPAQQTLSRGEAKLFVVGLLLAQGEYLVARQGRVPLVLVDDLASELDGDSRGRFFERLRVLGAQTLVTTVDQELLQPGDGTPMKVFHVERGQTAEVI